LGCGGAHSTRRAVAASASRCRFGRGWFRCGARCRFGPRVVHGWFRCGPGVGSAARAEPVPPLAHGLAITARPLVAPVWEPPRCATMAG